MMNTELRSFRTRIRPTAEEAPPMTRMIATLAAAVFLSLVASATLAKDDRDLKAAAESYVRHPVTQRVMDSLLSMDTMRTGLVAQLQARGTELTNDQIEALSRILMEEMDRLRPQLETLMMNAAIETYTLEEIQAFIEFYGSEFGASAMMKAGKMMRSFNAGAAPLFQQLFERLGARIDAEFSK